MSFRIDDEKLLEKYKTIWTKIEDLHNTELNVLSVYDDRYVKTKIGIHDDKVYIKWARRWYRWKIERFSILFTCSYSYFGLDTCKSP